MKILFRYVALLPLMALCLSACSPFARIPAGSFTMGNSIAADTDITDASPHTVTVSEFYMAKNLVTWAEYQAVQVWAASNGYTDMAAGYGKADTHPVEMISWWDSIKYCNARSQKEGLTPVYTVNGAVMKTGTTVPAVNWTANGYRLPTEAEWEKAARGGLSSAVNNFHPPHAPRSESYTTPVESFVVNGYGLKDVVGKVWQWCWDCYGTYDTASPTNPRGVLSDSSRVLRGGCWDDGAYPCCIADRYSYYPSNTGSIGLRVARSSVR